MKVSKVKTVIDTEEVLARLDKGFAEISDNHVVGREIELDAIKLALLTGRHVMLDGPPGTAKSLLARNVFKLFTGANVFFKQLMPGTMPEEVFGAINPQVFRTKGEICYNTAGFLPEADFAFLDEVYRGPSTVLNSLLLMLNERQFVNGPKTMDCPLRTCIGTTNYVGNDALLHAFRDRWFVYTTVSPVHAEDSMRKIANIITNGKPFECVDPVTIKELDLLREAVRRVVLPESVLDLYINFVSKYRSSGLSGGVEVTDRRFAEGIRAVQAGWLIADGQISRIDDIMNGLRFVFISNKAHSTIFESVYNSQVGEFRRTYEERPRFDALQKAFKAVRDQFDEKKAKPFLKNLDLQLGEVADALNQSAFTVPDLLTKLTRLKQEAAELSRAIKTVTGELPKQETSTVDDETEVGEIFSRMIKDSAKPT